MAHERDVAVDAEEFHRQYSVQASAAGLVAPFGRHTCPIDTAFNFFCRPYQRLTRPREKTTAENIEVRMPRQCTTAKPRTGPDPKARRAMPAISVVTLESRIVAQARS